MSEEISLSKKIKKAALLLFFQHHRLPGAKGWELRKVLGKDYMKIIKLLNRRLDELGLEVKIVHEGSSEEQSEDFDRARFYIVSKSPMIEELSGWRIDTLAVLAASIAYITSKQGKATRQEVEEFLREKFPDWKIEQDLNIFIRRGYLSEDEVNNLYIGWRTRAEIDIKTLLEIIAGYVPSELKI
ncbi:MAG: hypothetical protein QXW62_06735 [Candidatus Methanomethylicaceae archaeon]|nr:hypothetical protein [Candidatus Verstraetearchaeota archaeon]